MSCEFNNVVYSNCIAVMNEKSQFVLIVEFSNFVLLAIVLVNVNFTDKCFWMKLWNFKLRPAWCNTLRHYKCVNICVFQKNHAGKITISSWVWWFYFKLILLSWAVIKNWIVTWATCCPFWIIWLLSNFNTKRRWNVKLLMYVSVSWFICMTVIKYYETCQAVGGAEGWISGDWPSMGCTSSTVPSRVGASSATAW